jgi:hypothetical protein
VPQHRHLDPAGARKEARACDRVRVRRGGPVGGELERGGEAPVHAGGLARPDRLAEGQRREGERQQRRADEARDEPQAGAERTPAPTGAAKT